MGLDNDSTQRILVLLCTEGRAVLMEPKADGKIIGESCPV